MRAYEHLSRSIAGRTAIITGAASGMGRATAHLFAREGANVAVTDLDAAGAEAVVAEIDAARAEDKTIGQAAAFALDVGDRSAIQSVVQATSDRFGGIDIIINNAGFSRRMEIEDPDFDATWAKALEVMLSAHQHIIRAALPHLQRRLQAEPGGPSPQR